MLLFAVHYVLFCSFMWRLRGGAWSTLLHIHMGTTVTRVVSAFLMSLPLAWWFANWYIVPGVTFGLWFGLVLGGYGPFMGMGDHAFTPAKTWINFFPKLLGLRPYSVAWDFAGMWFSGVLIYSWVVLIAVASSGTLLLLALIPISGLVFAGSYYLMSQIPDSEFPIIPGFTAQEHEVFGELCAGFWTGVLLFLCTNL